MSHTSASSAGMNVAMTSSETSDLGANDTFSDNDYLLFGHNSKNNGTTENDINISGSAVERRVVRDWFVDVTESDATTMRVDITFDFSELELEVFPSGTASNYKLLFRTTNAVNDNWTVHASASSLSGDQVTFTDVSFTEDGFVTLASIDEINSPLPVRLLDFSAATMGRTVYLEWSTADESGNSGFMVERSANGADFDELMFVQGAGETDEITTYREIDLSPQRGNNYYRLKQIDFNGNITYSGLVRVYMDETLQKSLKTYPNPASDILTLELPVQMGTGRLILRDKWGRPVLDRELHAVETIELDVAGLNNGIYLLEIHGLKQVETRKILIRR